MTDITEELQELRDHHEIVSCLHRYSRGIDRFERRDGHWRIVVRLSTTESIVDVETADMTTAATRFVPWTRDRSDLSYDRPLLPLRASAKEPSRTRGDGR